MTTATLVPFEEYLPASCHPHRDRVGGELEKIADYLNLEVPAVGVVDPCWQRTALQIGSNGQRQVTPLTSSGLAFTLPLSEAFAGTRRAESPLS